MLSGLGLAETIPGPLIQAVQYVDFLGAYRHPAGLSPLAGGLLASVVATWATYALCFLWIFLGAPHIERLQGSQGLSGVLTAIVAAVVGVILNLSLWSVLRTLFEQVEEQQWVVMRLEVPVWSTLNGAVVLAAVAGVVLFRFSSWTPCRRWR